MRISNSSLSARRTLNTKDADFFFRSTRILIECQLLGTIRSSENFASFLCTIRQSIKIRLNGPFQILSFYFAIIVENDVAPLEIPNSNNIEPGEYCLIADTSICIEYESSPCLYVMLNL